MSDENVNRDVTSSSEPLKKITEEEAVAFLTLRVKGEGESLTDTEQQAAVELAQELGYLALALEQAAAYIATKKTTFADYLRLYRNELFRLLENNKDQIGSDQQSVAVTCNISFEEIAKTEPAAADLLTLCAFFAPENIPAETVFAAAEGVIQSIQAFFGNMDDAEINQRHYDALLEPLMNYSLVSKNEDTATFSLHHIVQTIRKDSLSPSELLLWAERALEVLFESCPSVCARFLPHYQFIAKTYPDVNANSEGVATICGWAAYCLERQGRYDEAELWSVEALKIRRAALPKEELNIAFNLENLATLYKTQGRYVEAEQLYIEALQIFRNKLGEEHSWIANSLNNLAALYDKQKRYGEAESLYLEALRIRRVALPKEELMIAISLNNLATLYKSQGRYDEAEPLLVEALEMFRKALGDNDPDTKGVVANLEQLQRKKSEGSAHRNLFTQKILSRFARKKPKI